VSLFGALHLGGSSLAAQQTALQVTGNNIANAGTAGYSRQVATLASGPDVKTSSGQYVGSGVGVVSIQRQVSESLNESLRDASSGQTAANTLNDQLSQLQAVFGPLNDSDLSSQLTSFFNSFSTLANNPTDPGQRAVVIQNGQTIASNLQSLRQQVVTLRDNNQAQIATTAKQADALLHQVADLNQQISNAGSSSSAANSLMDQRDLALSQLSGIMDIRVINQGGGNLNVLVGSVPIVTGNTTRGLAVTQVADSTGKFNNTNVVFGDNGDSINISGGSLGGLLNARDNYLTPAVGTIDNLAGGLINAVNTIHSQGQGLAGFSTLTGATQVLDTTSPLNAASTNIKFPPTNGSFNLYMTDATTGQTSTKQINVNLSGQGTQTSLTSLAASITAAGNGTVSATVNPAGNLVISSNNSNVTFGFGEDSSGTLAALGLNTFFTGDSALNIAVNTTLTTNSDFLATGRGNVAGSNTNAQALALGGAAAVSQLGGQGINDFYTNYIGDLAAKSKTASDNATAQGAIHDTLFAQQQAISGVSMDEEAVNLTQYQRAFQGSARFISVVDDMMQTVLGLIQ
jgi:flagellar hook-associated protein 1 FlgK